MMSSGGSQERLACLIVAHNLGDAVIQSMFLQQLARRQYAQGYLVWTRPQVAFLFESIPRCEVICSQFPVGTSKQMGGIQSWRFVQAAIRVRHRRPSVTMDLIGDFRDRFFGRLIGAPRHLSIGWSDGHPFRRLIRNPFGEGRPFVIVPASVRNVYAAYHLMLDKLVAAGESAEESVRRDACARTRQPLRVGLHPFASQACKLWPQENWRLLASGLLERGTETIAFASPHERPQLQNLFGGFGERLRLVTGSLSEFAGTLGRLDVLVGLDSFAVHMAQRQGVRSVMINAGNPPDLWAPPLCHPIGESGGCGHYPCYNVPKCENTSQRYVCIRSITPERILQLIAD